MYIGGNRVDGMHHIKKRTANSNYCDNNIIILIVCQKCSDSIAKSYALTLPSISFFLFLHMSLILILLLTHT